MWTRARGVEAGHLLGGMLDTLGEHEAAEEVLRVVEAEAHTDEDRERISEARAANLFRGLGRTADAEAVTIAAERAITDPNLRAELTARRATSTCCSRRIYGGQAVIAGQTVQGTTLSAVMPVQWPALQDRLAELGVPEEDLNELADAIARDDGVGIQTQSWLGRLAGRVGTGAVTLTTGITIEVIALEIAKALGAA